MTPEQAREIDRLEFEADCRQARERAAEAIAQRRRDYEHWRSGLPGTKPAIGRTFDWSINRKQPPRTLEHDGKVHTVSEWAGITGLPAPTIASRIHMGWPAARILTTPVARHRRRPT